MCASTIGGTEENTDSGSILISPKNADNQHLFADDEISWNLE
jgi:hypothetical protein